MKLKAFKITNFRSIVDSGWVPFSPDGITVFVGQNESGKSSILEALYFALSTDVPTSDDFRIDADLPEVTLRIGVEPDEADTLFGKISGTKLLALKEYLISHNNLIELECGWIEELREGKKVIEAYCQTIDPDLDQLIEAKEKLEQADSLDGSKPIAGEATQAASGSAGPTVNPTPPTQVVSTASPAQSGADAIASQEEIDIGVEIWNALPLGVLFNEESGRLPNQVDIDAKGRPTGEGAKAALNFLKIADIDLPVLLKGDRRARENTLNKANSRVSQDFNTFWSQTIGKSGRLSLKCDIDNYPSTTPEQAGKAHLVFWICDGNTQLYPRQRSQGVRWFVSFYLQLKASEKAKNPRVFLLDEPGANLHSKAQGDVLSLINKLGKDTSTVVYSTHSPQMLEYSKLFRVHAVQRDSDLDDSPSRVIDAHKLGSASTDTLSPVLTTMGADLSQHQVVRKKNNVLLEEMSGYYYISSFWKLREIKQDAHFIAATGVNKVESLANMFRGWDLDFIVAIDDDKQGREVFNSLKRELFGDSYELASKKLLKLPDCPAIEDVFSRADFSRFVIGDETISISGTNADYVKEASRSKPVLAFNFALAVDNKSIIWGMLSVESQKKISKITDALVERLG